MDCFQKDTCAGISGIDHLLMYRAVKPYIYVIYKARKKVYK